MIRPSEFKEALVLRAQGGGGEMSLVSYTDNSPQKTVLSHKHLVS